MPNFIGEKEFSQDGLLSSYYKKFETDQYVDIGSLLKDLLLLTEVSNFIRQIEEKFGKTKIELLKGNQMELKVTQNNGRSIGYMFGLLGQL